MEKPYHDLAIESITKIMGEMPILQFLYYQLPEEQQEAFKVAHAKFYEAGADIINILKSTPVE